MTPAEVGAELEELDRRRKATDLARVEVLVDGLPAAVRRACDRALGDDEPAPAER